MSQFCVLVWAWMERLRNPRFSNFDLYSFGVRLKKLRQLGLEDVATSLEKCGAYS